MFIQSPSLVLGSVALALAVGVTAADAGDPHERNGFLIGFNLGGGTAEIEWEADDVALSSDDREDGGAANFRIGYAVRPDLALALEVTGWARTYDVDGIDDGEATVSFSVTGPSLTWYPGAQGFFLRGTIGVGRMRAEVKGDLGAFGQISVTGEDSGVGLALAAGHEWRLTQKFSLGVELDLGVVDAGEVDGGDLSANFANLTGAFNWYW